jgi:Lrp/AsnC family transcriptional regulator, leucine-responsive regulatory protein
MLCLVFLGSKPVPGAVGAAVKRVPDVPDFHLMDGTADYLLKVVAQMHSSFALRTVFKTTALPV